MFLKNSALVLVILVCSKYVQTSPLKQEPKTSATTEKSVSTESNDDSKFIFWPYTYPNGSIILEHTSTKELRLINSILEIFKIISNSSVNRNAKTEPTSEIESAVTESSSENDSTTTEPTSVDNTTTTEPPTTTESPKTIVRYLVSPPNTFESSQVAVPINYTALFRGTKSKLIFWQTIDETGHNWEHAFVNQSNFQEVVPKNTFVYWRFIQLDGSITWQCAYAFDDGYTHLEPANLNTFILSLHDFEDRTVFWQETYGFDDIIWESASVNQLNFQQKVVDGRFIYWVNPEADGLWQCAYVKAKDALKEDDDKSSYMLPDVEEVVEQEGIQDI